MIYWSTGGVILPSPRHGADGADWSVGSVERASCCVRGHPTFTVQIGSIFSEKMF